MGGTKIGSRSGTHFSTQDYEQIGKVFCETLLDFFDPDPIKVNYDIYIYIFVNAFLFYFYNWIYILNRDNLWIGTCKGKTSEQDNYQINEGWL